MNRHAMRRGPMSPPIPTKTNHLYTAIDSNLVLSLTGNLERATSKFNNFEACLVKHTKRAPTTVRNSFELRMLNSSRHYPLGTWTFRLPDNAHRLLSCRGMPRRAAASQVSGNTMAYSIAWKNIACESKTHRFNRCAAIPTVNRVRGWNITCRLPYYLGVGMLC